MKTFIYNVLPSRVIFGNGTLAQIVQEITNLGCSKALILTTPRQSTKGEQLKELLGDMAVDVYTNATMHTPTNVTDDAVGIVQKLGADVVIALGGGSTIGLAKAIALRTDLPQIAIPTTYAGSEATPIIGQTENSLKTTLKTLKVLPEVIIYDVSLTMTLPTRTTITSGLNAIAHAVEALYSKEANPITDTLAGQGISSIAKALPILVNDSQNLDARSEALYGAWVCGTCLSTVGMGLHHKLCHTLGGTFNMPHAETHTVILPHSMAYNAPYAQEAMAKVANSLGVSNAAQGIFDLSKSLGAPSTLKELGMKEEDLEKAADIASKSPYPNPAPLEKEGLLQLLRNAYGGVRPN
ncbi:iron-containing alcohol dehydrogenase [Guyanagaster necrorhizus]|uniref:Iron-containing alcohol dehydrogenase n=1 Tax=Guyanagaster necrorhizus TaxID=856835 RepID=A0A9P7VQ10_9AGAR|nr:iron-containing alcohol dehydrogenase [Guyanagaster necrorhizus MCA 3950]KAG7444492.1 iron-containing alcohol dehydrogenase [Guyanagaster necrorhizus MCA 3950]